MLNHQKLMLAVMVALATMLTIDNAVADASPGRALTACPRCMLHRES